MSNKKIGFKIFNYVKSFYIKSNVRILSALNDTLAMVSIVGIIILLTFCLSGNSTINCIILLFATGNLLGAYFNRSFKTKLSAILSGLWTFFLTLYIGLMIVSIFFGILRELSNPSLDTLNLFYSSLSIIYLIFNYLKEHIEFIIIGIFCFFILKSITIYFQGLVNQITMAINKNAICACCRGRCVNKEYED